MECSSKIPLSSEIQRQLHLQTWRKNPGFFVPFTAKGVASKTYTSVSGVTFWETNSNHEGRCVWESVSLEKNQGKVGGSRCIKGIIYIYVVMYVVMYV